MLHIVLGILKIIGIIIAVILGVALLIICAVLFAAFRYNVSASADGDLKSMHAQVRFSWLCHLISGFVTYQNEKLDWQVKVAWKNLNVPKEEIEETIEETNSQDELLEEFLQEELKEEAVKNEKVHINMEETPKLTESVDSKKQTKKNKTEKKKKESLFEKIRCSFQKISDKMKEIQSIKETVVSFIQAEEHKKAFQKLLKELLRLLKKIKPKKLKGNVEFGFEDPYKTGSILAYLSMLYPFYGDNINIHPKFEESVLRGDVYLKGRIRISYMMNMGIRLILNKNIRSTIKDVMKLVAKK